MHFLLNSHIVDSGVLLKSHQSTGGDGNTAANIDTESGPQEIMKNRETQLTNPFLSTTSVTITTSRPIQGNQLVNNNNQLQPLHSHTSTQRQLPVQPTTPTHSQATEDIASRAKLNISSVASPSANGLSANLYTSFDHNQLQTTSPTAATMHHVWSQQLPLPQTAIHLSPSVHKPVSKDNSFLSKNQHNAQCKPPSTSKIPKLVYRYSQKRQTSSNASSPTDFDSNSLSSCSNTERTHSSNTSSHGRRLPAVPKRTVSKRTKSKSRQGDENKHNIDSEPTNQIKGSSLLDGETLDSCTRPVPDALSEENGKQ